MANVPSLQDIVAVTRKPGSGSFLSGMVIRLARRRWPIAGLVAVHVGAVASSVVSAPAAFGLALASIIVVAWLPHENTGGNTGVAAPHPPEQAPHGIQVEQVAADPAEEASMTAATVAARVWTAAIDALPDAVVVIDGLGRVMFTNGPARELLPKAAAGLPISSVARNPELLDAMDEARRNGRRLTVEIEDRVPVRRKLLAVVTPADESGDPLRAAVVIVLKDVSEEERLAQMRADFIANASHELRTPLASLRGFVETLQGPARNDEAARERFLAIMASQAARMTRLIDDLLSLSRIEMRAHVPPRGEVDLNDVAQFVAQSLEPVAEALGVSIRTEIESLPAMVRGDRDELVQVVQNLTHNAIKYGTREQGHVTIRVDREPRRGSRRGQVSLEVIDDGPGIAAEHLPRLTERFYRVNAAVSREKGGTGLGLAIVKNIVNRHRGELRIASKVGEGAKFAVILDELDVAAKSA